MSAPRSVRRTAAVLVALIGASLLFTVEPAAGPARGAAEDGGAGGTGASTVTVHGTKQGFEDFTGLAVTVSKTRGLANEAVTITWTGATPTPRRPVGTDFLQFMQCWGDPAAADFRETCQFGMDLDAPALYGDIQGVSGGSVSAGKRSLELPAGYIPGQGEGRPRDPAETLPADARMVPFRSVSGERSKDGTAGQPYDRITRPDGTTYEETDVDVMGKFMSREATNEVPYGLTGGDGTGRAIFEVQNDPFAPHLGCGAAVSTPGGVQPRACSLVIVPRGHLHPYTGANITTTDSVHGSPFTPAVWQHRIVVPLEFAPVESACPIDKAEQRTVGTEVIAEAMTSWQPAICAGNGPVIGYSAISDFEVPFRVTSQDSLAPGLGFSADPVPATEPALVHAPVALSSTVVAINVDYNIINPLHVSGPPTPGEIERLRALALRDLKLTPRLLAKLLTQSYVRDALGPVGTADRPNPNSIRYDEEFLTLNPAFRHWSRDQSATLEGLMVPVGSFAAARDVWRWILADPEAKSWLGGARDEFGMVINENYRGLFATAPETFPKADPRCGKQAQNGVEYQRCTIDARPYMGSLNEAALQTLRAWTKGKGNVLRAEQDVSPTAPAGYLDLPRTTPGSRFAMSITDSASAARYGLFTAQLCKPKRDAGGKIVMPDDCRGPSREAVAAAVATAGASAVEGVRVIDPAKAWATPGAYPLSTVTYAVADTSEPADKRRDYAKFLRYAVGAGQEPGPADGQLPEGYVPLPQAMREQTMIGADKLQNWVTATTAPPTEDTGGSGDPDPTPTDGVPSAGATPSAANPAPGVQPPANPASQSTLGSPLGIIRFILIAALAMGLVGGVAGPIMQRFATRKSTK